MSLLTIVQGACARLSLPVPTGVVTSTSDVTAQQMWRLANEEGRELSRRAAWKALLREQTFTTVATAAQTSALASDLDWIVPDTMWNRTSDRKVFGPVSPQDWQRLQAIPVGSIDLAYRIRATSLLMTPTPTAGETVAYEYVTNKWCQTSGGTAQTDWAADTDTALLDEELHTLGLVWRFKRAKGLDYSQEIQNYEVQVRQALLREGTRPRISTDLEPESYGIITYTVTP